MIVTKKMNFLTSASICVKAGSFDDEHDYSGY